MADNFGIFISAPGSNVTNAPANKMLMDTNYPFIKIDTQNNAGFQTITLLLTTDPPEPVGTATVASTVVYKFKHGYTYVPSVESLIYVSNPGASTNGSQTYFQDQGQLSSHTAFDYASFYVIADNTWVYFIIRKYNNGSGSANVLTGTNLQITTHVFVEDIGI